MDFTDLSRHFRSTPVLSRQNRHRHHLAPDRRPDWHRLALRFLHAQLAGEREELGVSCGRHPKAPAATKGESPIDRHTGINSGAGAFDRVAVKVGQLVVGIEGIFDTRVQLYFLGELIGTVNTSDRVSVDRITTP